MKQTIRDIILFTVLVSCFFYVSSYNEYISKQVLYSVNLWLTKIIPTLFPTFILVDILYNSNIPKKISDFLHINYIYLLSVFSGSPANAYILSNYNTNLTKILASTQYVSLIFCYIHLNNIFNNRQTFILILLNIVSNFILIKIIKPENIFFNSDKRVSNVVLTSVKKSINTLIGILGTLILVNILPVYLIDNVYLKSFLLSLLEITSSLNNLALVNIDFNLKLLFTCISISFCGFCILLQIKSIVNEQQCDFKRYFLYRLLHFVIFTILALIFFNFL